MRGGRNQGGPPPADGATAPRSWRQPLSGRAARIRRATICCARRGVGRIARRPRLKCRLRRTLQALAHRCGKRRTGARSKECESAQGGVSSGRAWHSHAAGDQGAAQGDAAGGRQADHPVRAGGGGGGRGRGVHLRHRARQDDHGGPFRPRVRAVRDPGQEVQDQGAGGGRACGAEGGRGGLHPAAGAQGARPRGLVRAAPGRRRAVRGDAGRRPDRRRAALPRADGGRAGARPGATCWR